MDFFKGLFNGDDESKASSPGAAGAPQKSGRVVGASHPPLGMSAAQVSRMSPAAGTSMRRHQSLQQHRRYLQSVTRYICSRV